MMKNFIKILLITITTVSLLSCKDFLDVVPDDTSTIKKSFKRQEQARKFLYSIYSYIPDYTYSGSTQSASMLSSHEIWQPAAQANLGGKIARNQQKIVDPYLNFWDGSNGGWGLYRGIRHSNIFLDNISQVGDMSDAQKNKWIAEAKFLKAYFLFYLTRMYGPIVLVKDMNIPVSSPKNETSLTRAPLNSTFNYINKLLNEAINTEELPARVSDIQRNYGRITKSIAYAMKAKVAVTAASPLFNGNNNYSGFKNKNGDNPFNVEEDPAKWDSAMVASKEAIDYIESQGFQLYEFSGDEVFGEDLSDSIKTKMTLRNAFTLKNGQVNPGVIWASSKYSTTYFQKHSLPIGLNHENPSNLAQGGAFSVPLKTAEMFYSNHGVPIIQDKTRNNNERYNVAEVEHKQRFYLKEGYNTARFNMHREPRYYAYLDFDGSIHYGNGIYKGGSDKYHYIQAKKGQINAIILQGDRYSPTGFWPKKLANYRTEIGDSGTDMTYTGYNWPIMRLEDLYLLYAEAKNEADGPGSVVYEYLNKVREHAGIPTVQESWDNYSTNPNQYKSKEGLREIIHRERLNELVFEGQWYWDLRRWKEASEFVSREISGWSIEESNAEDYYKPNTLFKPSFGLKDYFWPISEGELNKNTKLTQNPGW